VPHFIALCIALVVGATPAHAKDAIRIATFNAALNRPEAGALRHALTTPEDAQAKAIAAIIQQLRPDVLLLQEFDYDAGAKALTAFHDTYLRVGQAGRKAIEYRYRWAVPTNTGLPTPFDLDRDGKTGGPGDAHGFGRHPGQYGYAILSRIPFDVGAVRTFQRFLWTDMPDARLPSVPATKQPWYGPKALATLRLSSKNHVIVPLRIGARTIFLLAAHPTPPVFDGPEDRNGRRNADEIRLLADALSPSTSGYLVDDAGQRGGLPAGAEFVILGDLNADPVDGDSAGGAIAQLLDHPRVHPGVARGEAVPSSVGGRAHGAKPTHKGNPAHDTAEWGLRVDYVLPSRGLRVIDSGVYWPAPDAGEAALVTATKARKAPTDHRLVWIDLAP
jgi:endonuclease/exonuclease/phosphatase family metal-dependent hydrolase